MCLVSIWCFSLLLECFSALISRDSLLNSLSLSDSLFTTHTHTALYIYTQHTTHNTHTHTERERALEEASFRPLLAVSAVSTATPDPSQLYPHVYDSLATARLSAAYIAGAKVYIGSSTCLALLTALLELWLALGYTMYILYVRI